jgi:hypothetical protein
MCGYDARRYTTVFIIYGFNLIRTELRSIPVLYTVAYDRYTIVINLTWILVHTDGLRHISVLSRKHSDISRLRGG